MMKVNKVLVKLYVPMIGEQYEVMIPTNKRIYNVIIMLTKAVNEFSGGYYQTSKMPMLYDRETTEMYDLNLSIKESTIRNGSEIVLI